MYWGDNECRSGNTYSVNRLVELLGGNVEYIPKRRRLSALLPTF